MGPAKHGPRAGGDGYLIAPLKGNNAEIIEQMVLEAERRKVPREETQALIWAVTLEQWSYLVEHPRTPELLTAGQLASIRRRRETRRATGALFEELEQRLPEAARHALELQRRFADAFDRFSRGEAPFAELEEAAVLSGAPPDDPDARKIPTGRWQVMPGGYYARFGTEHYASGTVEYYVPHRFERHYDALHRPTRVVNLDSGVWAEFEYYDDTNFAPHPKLDQVKAWPFKKLRIFVPARLLPGGKEVTVEGEHVGHVFTGPLSGRAGSRAPSGAPVYISLNRDAGRERAQRLGQDMQNEMTGGQAKRTGMDSVKEYASQWEAGEIAGKVFEAGEGYVTAFKTADVLSSDAGRFDKTRAVADAMGSIPGTAAFGMPLALSVELVKWQLDVGKEICAALGPEETRKKDDGGVVQRFTPRKSLPKRQTVLGRNANKNVQGEGAWPLPSRKYDD